MDIIVDKIVGITYLIIGLSMIFQTRPWVTFVETLQEQGIIAHFIALFTLPMSLAVILLHPEWSLTPNVIVTLLGWTAFIKSCFFLLSPKLAIALIPRKSILKRVLFGDGVILTALSLLVLYTVYIHH
ncbi:MAG: hypothetical protein U1E78_06620 [Gammaproteobacteria bacterium]